MLLATDSGELLQEMRRAGELHRGEASLRGLEPARPESFRGETDSRLASFRGDTAAESLGGLERPGLLASGAELVEPSEPMRIMKGLWALSGGRGLETRGGEGRGHEIRLFVVLIQSVSLVCAFQDPYKPTRECN